MSRRASSSVIIDRAGPRERAASHGSWSSVPLVLVVMHLNTASCAAEPGPRNRDECGETTGYAKQADVQPGSGQHLLSGRRRCLAGSLRYADSVPFTSNNVHGRYTETPARAPRPLAREPDGEPRASHECCMGRAVGLLGNLERRERGPGPQPPCAGRPRHTV